MSESLERTIETRIGDSTVFPVLEKLLSFFAGLRHRLFRDLIIQEQSKNELKSSYIRDFQITARHFNSLAFEVNGLAESTQSLQLDILPDGQILLTPVVLRPKHLEPFYSKETDEKLKKFDEYMTDWKEPGKGEDATAGMRRGKK